MLLGHPVDTTKLKPIQEKHVHEAFQLIEDNRTHLTQHMTHFYTLENIEETLFMIQTAISRYTRREGLLAGIWHEDKLAGMVGHHSLDAPNRSAQLQVWVGADYQRRGLATRALRSIIKYSFQDMSLNRLEMRFGHDNTAAQRLAEKLGFIHEGTLRQGLILNDQPTDAALYGLLRQDWPGA